MALCCSPDEEGGRDETPALADVRASNRALRSELSRHKADLEALKKKVRVAVLLMCPIQRSFTDSASPSTTQDPEFYAFLQSTDAGLLDFQDSDEEEEEVDEEPAQGGGRATKETAAAPADLLTLARAKAWCQDAAQGTSLGAVAKVLRAFRACAHYGDALGDADEYGACSPCFALPLPHSLMCLTLRFNALPFLQMRRRRRCASPPARPSTWWSTL